MVRKNFHVLKLVRLDGVSFNFRLVYFETDGAKIFLRFFFLEFSCFSLPTLFATLCDINKGFNQLGKFSCTRKLYSSQNPFIKHVGLLNFLNQSSYQSPLHVCIRETSPFDAPPPKHHFNL